MSQPTRQNIIPATFLSSLQHGLQNTCRLQSCGTCKEVLRHCRQLCQETSQQRAGVLFLKHNIWNDFDDLTDVARMYKAKAVPSFIFLTGGAMVCSVMHDS